jgi:hypothetical protein
VSWLSSIQGYPKDDRALTAGNESQIDADLATIADADGHRAYARLHLAIGDKDGARESLATSRCRSCGTCYKDSSAGSASCAVKARYRNVETPSDIQVSDEPLELSSPGHLGG